MSNEQSDRELLERAARAIGWRLAAYDSQGTSVVPGGYAVVVADGRAFGWRPLVDDGDALRLAGSCELMVDWSIPGRVQVAGPCGIGLDEMYTQDRMRAARRAIVRAAAEIGRTQEAAHG